jgi:signal transduction histidine kinase
MVGPSGTTTTKEGSTAQAVSGPEVSGDFSPAGDAARKQTAEADRDVASSLHLRFAFLAEASRCLADSLDYATTLTTVAGMALPHLGAWCIVDVVENGAAGPLDSAPASDIAAEARDHTIRRLAVLHPDPQKQARARALCERYPPAPADLFGAPRVMRTGRPEVALTVPEATLEATAHDDEHLRLLRELGVRAYMIVPMVARGATVGAITFVTADDSPVFGAADLLLAEDLASRCASAVDNARLYGVALTARAEAEASRTAVQAANQAKSDFLAVMSHELRTPLNAIGGYAELLELGVRGPMTEAQVEDLQRIQRAQRHLTGLIEQVLNYARLEAGRTRCELTDVNLDQALLTAEVLVAQQVSDKELSCECARGAGMTVRVDRAWLHQILVNLLANAVKFTSDGGRIDVRYEGHADRVELRVRDSGIGIPADKLEAIFEPFVQAGRRLNDPRPHEGMGLGLAISRDLARRMAGDLRVESVEGQGSTFSLTLPRV